MAFLCSRNCSVSWLFICCLKFPTLLYLALQIGQMCSEFWLFAKTAVMSWGSISCKNDKALFELSYIFNNYFDVFYVNIYKIGSPSFLVNGDAPFCWLKGGIGLWMPPKLLSRIRGFIGFLLWFGRGFKLGRGDSPERSIWGTFNGGLNGGMGGSVTSSPCMSSSDMGIVM